MLVRRRIHVIYHLKTSADAQETIEGVHRKHAQHCSVYRSLHKAIDTTTEYHPESINFNNKELSAGVFTARVLRSTSRSLSKTLAP